MQEGGYLFVHHGYGGENLAPHLTVLPTDSESFAQLFPTSHSFSVRIDTTQRHCTGWHDLATANSQPCPDAATLPPQFDQCRHCQTKTGFNPAFYNAASISPQQQARNAQPHLLYLAHFAPGVVKVGISWAQRGLGRLLDQGARSCLVIKTYPSATVARQYEAAIAAMPGIAETLQAKVKYKLLSQNYHQQAAVEELLRVRERIISELNITSDDHAPQYLDPYYTGDTQIDQPIIVDGSEISGRCIGMLGSLLLMEQDGRQFGLSLAGATGYRITIHNEQQPNIFKPQQASLF